MRWFLGMSALLILTQAPAAVAQAAMDSRALDSLLGLDSAKLDSVVTYRRAYRQVLSEMTDSIRRARLEEREQRIRSNMWPYHITEAVLRGEVLPGMTTTMVYEAWGNPDRETSTRTADRHTVMWLYGSDVVYFENGNVAMVQQN